MNKVVIVNRSYDSPLRKGQAKATRLRILGAAGQLFAERGYAATAVTDIALAAGVSRATVFSAVGGKAVLLKKAYDVALVGDDEAIPLRARPESRRVLDEPDLRRTLDGYSSISAGISGRVAAILEAVRGAPRPRSQRCQAGRLASMS